MNGMATIAFDSRPHARVHEVLGVGGRGGEVDDGLPRLVLDLDQLARVLGRVAALGDDERDRVTDVAHVADRERRRNGHLLAEHGVPRLAVAGRRSLAT